MFQDPSPEPVIHCDAEGVTFEDLKKIMDFMYVGEAIIVEKDHERFIKVGQQLKVTFVFVD